MSSEASQLPQFGREFLGSAEPLTQIGFGAVGGKATGLALAHRRVLSRIPNRDFPGIAIAIPTLTVLSTDIFDSFMERNDLHAIALSDAPDERIAHAFQQGELPAESVGDLRALIAAVHAPLAVRSSSLLEDALAHPFAGVYGTKMIPNNQADTDTRFHRLVEAVKFVYASSFYRHPKSYLRSIGQSPEVEKMAVVIQEIVGTRMNERFYPAISGVARSYNYYPTGGAAPDDGVVSLALGLGKQIVDGGVSWTYCPRYPKAPPPWNGLSDLIKNSQTEFWAVSMGAPPTHDPIREIEYLVRPDLSTAELDGCLDGLVSTYDAQSERLRPGIQGRGPRVLNFAPILELDTLPLNEVVDRLLVLTKDALGEEVEIEFAVALDPLGRETPRFGFLQARPMMVARQAVTMDKEETAGPSVLVYSERALGNGVRSDIEDVVYLRPEAFEARYTTLIASELETINRALVQEERPYLLMGFGRWGSADPWLGIPVDWGQISGARVIVEATLPEMQPDLSQGSHFFHNMISFEVLYLSVRHTDHHRIDWGWLDAQGITTETRFVRRVRLTTPLLVKVDGRTGRGVIRHG
jgi:hypothetical protein